MADDEFARSLTSVTTNLDTFVGGLNKGQGTLGQLTTNRELFDKLSAMSDSLNKVMGGLEQGNGTAGMVLKDKQLYENMNAAVIELRGTLQDTRTLLAAIQKDPKRYLNIKVSIF